MPLPRRILHVDMDAFFAAIEQLDDPALRGKPVLVGSDAPRGVVATASYEARPYGCHSAQPMAMAKRQCPDAIVVPSRGWRYREISENILAILDELTPLVEPLSIDEAFLDLTGSERLMGPPVDVARQLQRRIHDQLHLTASIGLAPNKFLAKLASDLNKPNGLTVIRPEDVDRVLDPLSLSKLWGLGPAAVEKFERFGIRHIADLRAMSTECLGQVFGEVGHHYRRLALGVDDRPVTPDSRTKSIGQEQTFGVDLPDPDGIRDVMLAQTEQVGWRLRKNRLAARSVVVKIRYGDYETITRSTTLPQATDTTEDLWQMAHRLFDKWAKSSFRPVRLIGVTAQNLTERHEPQLELFPNAQQKRQRQIDEVMDRIKHRFGKASIRRGRSGRYQ